MDSAEQKLRDQDIDVFGMTDVGKVRKRNEDQYLICSLHKQMRVHGTSLPNIEQLPLSGETMAFLALVADGVGGHAGGEGIDSRSQHGRVSRPCWRQRVLGER